MTDAPTDCATAVDPRYRAVASRDARFDGVFWTGVRSTGIFCRPSCPARTPRPDGVSFHASAAAAQEAGFRACRRCRPDAVPGSPAWDVAADVAGRAARLINDGVVDRDGVEGLAARLGYSARHLTRVLTDELGAGPIQLARTRRAHTARLLLETTDLPVTDVAFAAGFGSVRQFNDTVREAYATTPSDLRRRGRAPGRASGEAAAGVDLLLPVRTPFAAVELLAFLAAHLVEGVEDAGPGWYARTLRLPHGPGSVRLALDQDAARTGRVPCTLRLTDLRDLGAAVERVRRILDADADPAAVDADLARDPLLAPLVRATPGRRLPGTPDGDEAAIRTVLGQQVSLAGAISLGGKLVAAYGEDGLRDAGGPTRLFPSAAALADVEAESLPMPRARARALVGLCAALADGGVPLDRSLARAEVRERLLALKGIGPWTADYVAMRALGDPDVFLPGDLALRKVLGDLGEQSDPAAVTARAEAWRPWRSYAVMALWGTLDLKPAKHAAAHGARGSTA